MESTILMTGANGSQGRHVANALLERGQAIPAFTNTRTVVRHADKQSRGTWSASSL